ncbi:MAG TPA: ABC transporter permease subunit [Paracoccaceae bacterium]|nr:ABC transporter permease subunit [Paracoccaceae bacterium]
MTALFSWMRGIRASNLVFLSVFPVIIWLIVTSRSYGPALKAVLGIESDPWTLFVMFLAFSAVGVSGFLGSLWALRSLRPDEGPNKTARDRRSAALAFAAQTVLLALLSQLPAIDTYLVSVVVNEFDPRSVDFVIVADNTFILDPDFQVAMLVAAHKYLVVAAGLALLSLGWAIAPISAHRTLAGRVLWIALLMVNFVAAFYVLMLAHAGFAVGLMVTLRAAFFAYVGASILGLVWALLTRLNPSRMASIIFAVLGAVLVAASVFFFTRPHVEVELVGSLDGRIGIVSGTPQGLTDTIRYGEFGEMTPDEPYKVRSLATVEQAVDMLEKGTIAAALLPQGLVTDLPILWQADYLPITTKTVAIVCLALGALFLLLVGIGAILVAHPLAVFSDFFVDTIRGVPMLVIILYVGLPLAGALKSASAGYIDLQMMTRGIMAIAIGYSAYMAEIFRAGIEAIPKGQIEAARTLGLKELQIARFIIVPQAVAIVLPALGNEFIAMLKDTSLVSILSVRDLTQRMREFQAQSFLAFEPFNSAALIYVLLTLIAASGIKSLDRMVNKGKSH